MFYFKQHAARDCAVSTYHGKI